VFFLAILWYSQNGNDSQQDLAKLGYKINMIRIFFKSFSISGYLLESCKSTMQFFRNFWLNYGYWKTQKSTWF
jgi:hypothetical protein